MLVFRERRADRLTISQRVAVATSALDGIADKLVIAAYVRFVPTADIDYIETMLGFRRARSDKPR